MKEHGVVLRPKTGKPRQASEELLAGLAEGEEGRPDTAAAGMQGLLTCTRACANARTRVELALMSFPEGLAGNRVARHVADQPLLTGIAPGPAAAVVEHVDLGSAGQLRQHLGAVPRLGQQRCVGDKHSSQRLGIVGRNHAPGQRNVGKVPAIRMGAGVGQVGRSGERITARRWVNGCGRAGRVPAGCRAVRAQLLRGRCRVRRIHGCCA